MPASGEEDLDSWMRGLGSGESQTQRVPQGPKRDNRVAARTQPRPAGSKGPCCGQRRARKNARAASSSSSLVAMVTQRIFLRCDPVMRSSRQ